LGIIWNRFWHFLISFSDSSVFKNEDICMKLSGNLALVIAAICIIAAVIGAVIVSDTPSPTGLSGKRNEFVNNPVPATQKNTSSLPPDEAILACTGKSTGDGCQFMEQEGLSSGVCDNTPGVLACAPERQQNPGQISDEKSAPHIADTSTGTVNTGNEHDNNVQSVPVSVSTDKGTFSLTSDAGVIGNTLPTEYSCDGVGSTPGLAWSGAPEGTKEYALMMTTIPVDGSTRWNWVLYGIPGSATSLAKNSSGVGTTGTGSHGTVMIYDPPCPQGPGVKIYTITVYALSASPSLPVTADQVTGPVLTDAISSITLGKASINLSYARE
jgi:phosphatidylethanolamine-binding protein (PEBP) family uncharacterized protein